MSQIKLTENEQNKINELTEELVKSTSAKNVKNELCKRLSVFVEGVKIGLINKSVERSA